MYKMKGWRRTLGALLLSGTLALGAGAGSLASDFTFEEFPAQSASGEMDGLLFGAQESSEVSSEEVTAEEISSEEVSSEEMTSEEEPLEEAIDFQGMEAAGEELFTSEEDPVFDSGEETEGTTDSADEKAEEEVPEHIRAMFDGLTEQLVLPEPRASEETLYGEDASVALPEKYDSRANGLVTVPKLQRPFGMCWAFSTNSAMETSLLKAGKEALDLSEEHLAYFYAYREPDVLGNSEGDKNVLGSSGVYQYREGGNQILASLFLSTWSGLALESLAPYPTDEAHLESLPSPCTPEMAYQTTAYLQEAIFNSTNTVNRYKELIYKYGSLGISLNMDVSYLNYSTYGYSHPSSSKVNHAVTLVGWDDTYSKDNFKEISKVTSDGAFIVKNSWGTDFCDNGYFYVSYESKSLANGVTVTGTTSVDYPNNYFYDGSSSWSTSLPLQPDSNIASLANVFEVKAADGKCEALGEVMVADYSDASRYGIQIYTNLTDLSDPTSGTPAFSQPVSFDKEYAGIGTCKLPEEVILLPGSYYSVVLTNKGRGSISYLQDISSTSSDGWVSWVSVTHEKQSFSYDALIGKWTDLNSNGTCARIKAHTRSLDTVPSIALGTSSMELKVGESLKLSPQVSGATLYELSYVTSDSTVATVDENGQVRGVGEGTALITCMVKGKGLNLRASGSVKVKGLSAPTGVSATAKSYCLIRVKFNKVEDATSYVVERRTNTSSIWIQAANLGSGVTTWDDTSVEIGTKYYYRVYGVQVQGSSTLAGPTSSVASAKPLSLSAPKKVTPTKKSSYIKVKWSKVDGAAGYVLYRSVNGGEYTKVKKLTGNSYKDKSVSRGSKYKYMVRAYRYATGKNRYSSGTKSSKVTF